MLLADEPTVALDTTGTAAVLQAFQLARKRSGTAIVLAAHDDVRSLATTVYPLQEGVLREPS